MKKFMKYEIKGTYKFVLGIIAILIIASTIIQLNISKQLKLDLGSLGGGSVITGFEIFMLITSILVIFGAFLIAFFHIIGSFRKELYEDRGYLTFTLPLTGNQILGAKLIIALLWFTSLGISIVLYNFVLAMIIFGSNWMDIGKELFKMVNSGMLSIGIVSGLSSITTLILIYFSIALSRVSFKNKKIGGLWFVIFLILNAVSSYTVLKISEAIPYFLNLKTFKILHFYEIGILPNINNGIGNLMILGNNYEAYINVIGNLAQLAIAVAAFLATGYLIEKKVDI